MSDEPRIEARSNYANATLVIPKGKSVAVSDPYEAAVLLRDAPGVLAPNAAAKALIKKAGLQAPGVTGALPEPKAPGKPKASSLKKDQLQQLADANGLEVKGTGKNGAVTAKDLAAAVKAAGLAE